MLPYENATSGKAAIDDMQKILRVFGAKAFGTLEDFEAGEVMVHFQIGERRVTVRASFAGYAAAWIREHPYSSRIRVSEAAHRQRAHKQGEIAVWSILRDWIKGQVTAIQVGMLSVDGAFLGQILLPTGETVLDRVQRSGMLALPAPEA
jgi:hypothetical protein